jgi:hypothetical protein
MLEIIMRLIEYRCSPSDFSNFKLRFVITLFIIIIIRIYLRGKTMRVKLQQPFKEQHLTQFQ